MYVETTFCQMHATIRSVLNQAAQCLQQTDFTNVSAAHFTLDAVAAALHVCRAHDANKTGFVFPALEAFEPAVVTALQQDVALRRQLGAAIEARVAQWQRAETPLQKQAAGSAIKHLFMRFLIVTRTNLAREAVLHGFLKKYCPASEL